MLIQRSKTILFGIVNCVNFWHFGHHALLLWLYKLLIICSFLNYNSYIQVLPVITTGVLSCFEHQDICMEPHPHVPILATGGLDHNIKLWLPTAQQPTDLDGLINVSFLNITL